MRKPNDRFDTLQDQVALLSVGTIGIGRATARAFAGNGESVAVLARDSDALSSAAGELAALGAKDLTVSPPPCCRGGQDISPGEFGRVTDVTYHGQVFGSRSRDDAWAVTQI